MYFFISAAVILSGIYSIMSWGFRYSIDFAGGSLFEYKITKQISTDELKQKIEKADIHVVNVQSTGKRLVIRTSSVDEKRESLVRNQIQTLTKEKPALLRFETVGPVIGKELMQKTVIAGAVAILGILIYVSIAFRGFYFAVSAIAALIHDLLVVIGSYSIISRFMGAEVDALFVTAILTTMSFSVHDTIVIFDKVREYKKTEKNSDVETFANRALTETMIRSLNNSMTIVFMLLALLLMGGSTIRFFIMTLLIGTITGTYSSPFVATPIWVFLEQRAKRKK